MKQNRSQRPLSHKKSNRKYKDKNFKKKPNLIKTFFLTFWITGTSAEFLMWISDGIFTWAINTALTKFATSVLASIVVLVIRIIFYQTKQERSKFMNKVSHFFKRCGAYISANKRTFGGILTSLLSGAGAVTVTVLGYTMDLTSLVSQLDGMAWLQTLNINGFDVAPIITLLVWGTFVVWNTVAAVSRGWETPEECKANNEAEAAEKEEAKRLKAEEAAKAQAIAEAEAEIEQAKAEAEALIEKEKAEAEAQAHKAEEEAERAKLEAEEKAKEEAHRALVEKYKEELLAKQNAESENK